MYRPAPRTHHRLLGTLTAAFVAASLAMWLAGCAGTPERPEAELASAEARIDSAARSGARQFGAAELDTAQRKLTLSRQAAEGGDNLAARRLAEQAALDAELAGARGQTGQAREALTQLEDANRTLREEMERGMRQPPAGMNAMPDTGVDTMPGTGTGSGREGMGAPDTF